MDFVNLAHKVIHKLSELKEDEAVEFIAQVFHQLCVEAQSVEATNIEVRNKDNITYVDFNNKDIQH